MNIDSLSSLASRLCTFVALILIVVGVIEAIATSFGYTVLQGLYTGGRLLELAGILMIFVIALLLRQIRQELRARSP